MTSLVSRFVCAMVGPIVLVGNACSITPDEEPSRGPRTIWNASTAPLLDLAGTAPDGRLRFAHPVGATRLSNGALAIADGLEATVSVFDGEGRNVATVGRAGDGPGEFRYISWLGQCGRDSLFAWDFALLRMSVIADGRVVRQYRIPHDDEDIAPPSVIACSSSGVFATLTRPASLTGTVQPGVDFSRYSTDLVLLDDNGRVLADLGRVDAGETSMWNGQFALRPLGRFTAIAIGGEHVFVATQDSGYIDVLALDGQARSAIDLAVSPRRPTDANYAYAARAQAAWVSESNARRMLTDRLLGIPRPEYVPPFWTLHVDPRNRLWAVLSAGGDSVTRIRAATASGEILGDLIVPVGMQVFEIGVGYVLGTYETDDGEPHVAVFGF